MDNIEMDQNTDRQKEKQTKLQIGRNTDKQKKHSDKITDRRTKRQKDKN